MRKYIPDFIVLIEDGHEDSLHLVVEIKGYRREDAKDKKNYYGNVLDTGCEQSRKIWPLGIRRIYRGLSNTGRL
ncbi:hypothetical protein [Desulfoscipio geothermicus]|uniref:hypothetical protein n=1 Tax=Desulfoscipio geothermicus TaxID=39060 RepID=UPI001A959F2F|nr:hypothetical protein [Desulfoscipio geothermicus]